MALWGVYARSSTVRGCPFQRVHVCAKARIRPTAFVTTSAGFRSSVSGRSSFIAISLRSEERWLTTLIRLAPLTYPATDPGKPEGKHSEKQHGHVSCRSRRLRSHPASSVQVMQAGPPPCCELATPSLHPR